MLETYLDERLGEHTQVLHEVDGCDGATRGRQRAVHVLAHLIDGAELRGGFVPLVLPNKQGRANTNILKLRNGAPLHGLNPTDRVVCPLAMADGVDYCSP